MRVAAGVLMGTLGIASPFVVWGLAAHHIGWIDSLPDNGEHLSSIQVLFGLLMWAWVAYGGLRVLDGPMSGVIPPTHQWRWALSGAICCIVIGHLTWLGGYYRFSWFIGLMYVLVGLLAVVSLVRTKGDYLILPPS